MNIQRQLISVSALFLFLFCANAFAVEEGKSAIVDPRPVAEMVEYRPHFGAQVGLTNPEGSYSSGTQFGLDWGYQPYIPYGLGLEINHARVNGKGDNPAFERTAALVKGTYNFGGTTTIIKDSYVGLGAGTLVNGGRWSLLSAPLLGFDIPLNNDPVKKFTLGALAKYEITEGSDPDSFVINGMMKYWF